MKQNNAYSLELYVPKYKDVGNVYECKDSTSLGALAVLGKVSLKLTSIPTAADIYIEGENIGLTDSEKVAPYKEYNKNMRIVLRKNGYSNCIHNIKLNGDDINESVHCDLVKIEK